MGRQTSKPFGIHVRSALNIGSQLLTVDDPEDLRVATKAFDAAWMEYRALLPVKPVDAAATRAAMAKRMKL